MKREEIENKDKELIKRFRTIIHNKQKKSAPKTFTFWLIFFSIALILSGILLFKHKPATLVSTMPENSPRVQPAQVPVPAEQAVSNTSTVEIEAPSDAPKADTVEIVAPPDVPKADTVEIKAPPDVPKALDPPRRTAARETIPKSSDSILNNPVFEQDSPVELSNQGVQGNMPSGISIEKIISCSSVNDRQHSSPKAKFSLAQDDTAKIWMNVISENPPFTLTHVYYFNDRKYFEVPLAIRYHRMRTWSSVTLRSVDHIGRWRVEVVAENGVKLDQIEFIVVK